MNAPTNPPHPPNSLPAKPTSNELSPGLRSLLESGLEAGSIRDLVASPRMLAECRAALPMLRQRAVQPAGEDGVKRVIGRRLALYPVGEMTEGQWAAWWSDYMDACADLPEPALEAGMAVHVKDPHTEFMPKPGKLRALALSTENAAVRAYSRAQAAIAASVQKPAEKPRAAKEAVDRMMAEFRTQIHRTEDRPPLPPTHGATDEAGLTAEMRDRLGR